MTMGEIVCGNHRQVKNRQEEWSSMLLCVSSVMGSKWASVHATIAAEKEILREYR
jgi:hypothetical protein